MESEQEIKRRKGNCGAITIGPLDTISHSDLRSGLAGFDFLNLSVKSGSANSVFKVEKVNLEKIILNKNEGTVRCSED